MPSRYNQIAVPLLSTTESLLLRRCTFLSPNHFNLPHPFKTYSHYIRFDQFKPLVYVIRDGQRVGPTEDFLLVDETTTGRANIDSNDRRLR